MSGFVALPGQTAEAAPRDRVRIRLDFLDGLRGLAALYVVYYHAIWMYPRTDGVSRGWNWLAKSFAYGHYAVVIFIVLSGYCLMLPVVRSPGWRLRGGVADYLRRRARRILPPYYAALAFSLLALYLSRSVRNGPRTELSGWAVVSHLFLFQNWDDAWAHSINLPLWSVATEWQIYFVFPVLLVVWRRAGAAASVAIGFLLGYGVTSQGWFAAGSPWMLGPFAIGMVAASLSFPTDPSVRSRVDRVPWIVLAIVATAAAIALHLAHPEVGVFTTESLVDPLVGLAMSAFLVRAAQGVVGESRGGFWASRFLASRIPTGLGHFSFSLYLTHLVVLNVLQTCLIDRGGAPDVRSDILILAGPPLCVLVAYLFHLAFERRFMVTHPGRSLPPA